MVAADPMVTTSQLVNLFVLLSYPLNFLITNYQATKPRVWLGLMTPKRPPSLCRVGRSTSTQ